MHLNCVRRQKESFFLESVGIEHTLALPLVDADIQNKSQLHQLSPAETTTR